MVPIIYVSTYQICPDCHAKLRRGRPRFGPSKVRCGKCRLEIQTGLKEWNKLSGIKKWLISIAEIVAPSGIGIILPIDFMLNAGILFLLVPAGLTANFFNEDVRAFPFLVLAMAIIPAIRLLVNIRESNMYSRTGKPPYWLRLPFFETHWSFGPPGAPAGQGAESGKARSKPNA